MFVISLTSFTRAAIAALCLTGVAAAGAPAQAYDAAAATTAVPAPDPAKVAVVEQIYGNLRIIEVMGSGATQSILKDDDYKEYTPAQRTKLAQFFMDGLEAAKPSLLHKLALAHSSKYTMDQLNTLLSLSKITYVQQLLAKGADASLPDPDPSIMTPAEKSVFDLLDTEQYTEDFLTESADFSSINDDVSAVAVAAFQKLADWTKTQPQGT